MARSPTTRLGRSRRMACGIVVFFSLVAIALVADVSASPAHAQLLSFPPTPKPVKKPRLPQQNGQDQMLVQAQRIDYDYVHHRISAVGNVQIFYQGSSLEADRVIYDEKSKRLHAEGRVRLTEEGGNVTVADVLDLKDNYRDGFVDSLRVDTAERTRMSAVRAKRSDGNFTVFESSVYTACEACKDNPKKPPLWQIKAARIIHDKGEKMMYFESAKLGLFGYPIAYFPYFSAPDATVKRKTGFLTPLIGFNTLYGAAIEIPYFWALAPNYDVTFAPTLTSRQGPLLEGEFRHRLSNGSYSVRAAGIAQLDKSTFNSGAPGDRTLRGSVESEGNFALNDRWIWGWQGVVVSDRSFLLDYRPRLSIYRNASDPTQLGLPGLSEAISQAYITGNGDRSYFDARTIYYYGFSNADSQRQLPIIHPVIDYNYTFKNPVAGGEVSYKLNFVSLSRRSADFDAISAIAVATGACVQTADPAVKNPSNCLLRGFPGTYSRFSGQANWRRSITDSYGQVFTPFASVRVDTAALSVDNQVGVANYLTPGDTTLVRAMPTVGLEYRYPLINVQSWGTQTIEPIAQIIARPNETQVSRWPNEDAQSFTFDDGNLFKVDKFGGWDRVEGGGRANVGVQYTVQANQGGSANILFGQSYRLFGQNSFSSPGVTNTAIDSGADSDRSDYVARFSLQPNRSFMFTSRFRFDKDTFSQQRMEIETSANYDRWNISLLYGDYAAQPNLGFFRRRQGVLSSARYKIDENWVLFGALLYDVKANRINTTSFGLGYLNDCVILALNYATSYSYDVNGSNPRLVNTVMLQLSLRTLGDQSIAQSTSATNSNFRF